MLLEEMFLIPERERSLGKIGVGDIALAASADGGTQDITDK